MTRFPEAISLRSVMANKIAEELVKWVSRIGILQEILTDQDKNCMSNVVKSICNILQFKQLGNLSLSPTN